MNLHRHFLSLVLSCDKKRRLSKTRTDQARTEALATPEVHVGLSSDPPLAVEAQCGRELIGPRESGLCAALGEDSGHLLSLRHASAICLTVVLLGYLSAAV